MKCPPSDNTIRQGRRPFEFFDSLAQKVLRDLCSAIISTIAICKFFLNLSAVNLDKSRGPSNFLLVYELTKFVVLSLLLIT